MHKWKNLNVGVKVSIITLPILLAAIAIISVLSIRSSQIALEKESFSKLTAVREMKAKQIENYFAQIRAQIETFSENKMVVNAMKNFADTFETVETEIRLTSVQRQGYKSRLETYYREQYLPKLSENLGYSANFKDYFPKDPKVQLLQDLYISSNENQLGSKHELNAADDISTYTKFHAEYHPVIKNYLEKFGFYDIFFVEPSNGNIVYSVFKEADYGTSLTSGAYSKTNFAEVFDAAIKAQDTQFVKLTDFAPYHPSYNSPASFISSPIFDEQTLIGVVIFQMPIDAINLVMTSGNNWEGSGLGKTGQSFMVGADYTIKNELRAFIENPPSYVEFLKSTAMNEDIIAEIEKTGSAIGRQKVTTNSVQNAISGITDARATLDYAGLPVLSAFKPLEIQDVDWAIITEISQGEAFASVISLRNTIAILAVVALISVAAIIVIFTRIAISKPINQMLTAVDNLRDGDGDLTIRLPDFGESEIGKTAAALNGFIERIQIIMSDIKGAVENLSTASNRVSTDAEKVNDSSNSQAQSIEETSSALTQISVSITQNSENANSTNELASNAAVITTQGSDAVKETVLAMKEIASRVNLIEDFANQTDLLALNAMIEAARVGEAGAGFAVVAEAVRSLAEQSQKSAQEIGELAANSVKIAEDAGNLVETVSPDIQKTADLINEIAAATEEQAGAVREIKNAMENLDSTANGSQSVSENLAHTSRDLAEIVSRIEKQVSFFKT